jgi:hypothetical protein
MYHNSGDLSEREGYDFDQLYAIAKVQVRLVCINLTTRKLIRSSLRPFFMLRNSSFRSGCNPVATTVIKQEQKLLRLAGT